MYVRGPEPTALVRIGPKVQAVLRISHPMNPTGHDPQRAQQTRSFTDTGSAHIRVSGPPCPGRQPAGRFRPPIVGDMSSTPNPFRYKQSRRPAPGNGHYLLVSVTDPPPTGSDGNRPVSSLDESGPFSVSPGHRCVCLSHAVETTADTEPGQRKPGPGTPRLPPAALSCPGGPWSSATSPSERSTVDSPGGTPVWPLDSTACPLCDAVVQ